MQERVPFGDFFKKTKLSRIRLSFRTPFFGVPQEMPSCFADIVLNFTSTFEPRLSPMFRVLDPKEFVTESRVSKKFRGFCNFWLN